MSVVPSDSVSRAGESIAGFDAPALCISPPHLPSDVLVAALGADVKRYMDKYFASYQAYCRTAHRCADVASAGSASSSVLAGESSVSSSSSSGSSSCSSAAVLESSSCGSRVSKAAVRRLSKRMRVAGVTSTLPGGYCYVRAMRSEARESAAMALGPYPALGDLLSRPREEFIPSSATGQLSLVLRPNGVLHVGYADASVDGNYNRVMAGLARRAECAFGTYGSDLRRSPLADLPLDFASVSLETPVGGGGLRQPSGGVSVVVTGASAGSSLASDVERLGGAVVSADGVVALLELPSKSVVSARETFGSDLEEFAPFAHQAPVFDRCVSADVSDPFVLVPRVAGRHGLRCCPLSPATLGLWKLSGHFADMEAFAREQQWLCVLQGDGFGVFDPSSLCCVGPGCRRGCCVGAEDRRVRAADVLQSFLYFFCLESPYRLTRDLVTWVPGGRFAAGVRYYSTRGGLLSRYLDGAS